MDGRRAYKSEESFLEKISMGATGTTKALQDVAEHGHKPIVLERGSTSFKIWKEIKIKRVRVPDIVCVRCDRRIESRAKTNLEITMSHSVSTPERGWDFGLEDDDYIALVKCVKTGDRPIDWLAEEPVQYISVHSLRHAYMNKQALVEQPKGATEGFEIRLTWPSSVANTDGKITFVDSRKVQFQRSDTNRTVTLALTKRGLSLSPLVKVGDEIRKNQIIAAVVPIVSSFPCDKKTSETYYTEMLESSSLSDRYVASKCLAFFPCNDVVDALRKRMDDSREHLYVRLEAASSLLRVGYAESLSFFKELLRDSFLENRLESVIVLGEIDRDESCELLVKTLLDKSQHPEIRGGAAWSLGELGNKKALEALVDVFNEMAANIKIEAARSLMKLSEKYTKDIVQYIPKASEAQRAGVAWALSKSGRFRVDDLLKVMTDDEARKWIAWMIGSQDEARYIDQIEQLRMRDKEVYFAVTVLWKILSSWVNRLEIY